MDENNTAMTNEPEQVFRLDIRDGGIAVITIDVPGEAQNTLKAEFTDQANALFDQLERNSAVKGIVFISGKSGSFIAGADIHMLQSCASAAEVTALSEAGQAFFDRIARSRQPVVAAIGGTCLGGGLELALACHGRVAADDSKTVFGLPEVMLGLLPGSGGTQRLPRLIGVPAALDLMLTGKHIRADRARRLGLVDEVVNPSILLDAAIGRAKRLARQARKDSGFDLKRWAMESNPLGRKLVFDQAHKQMMAQTKGHYPAPKRILEVVRTGLESGIEAGLRAEAQAFGELAMTPEARQLMKIYFATTAMKKDTGAADPAVQPRQVQKIGVLGAGLMGAGIAYVSTARAGVQVRLKDKDAAGLSHGMRYINERIQRRLKRRDIPLIEAHQQRNRVTATLDYSGFRHLDMVIEAVFEDLALKHRMVEDIEANCGEHTIFASNTSSIPIARIAEGAKRPENVIGMHYFSPVDRMPLLEVIATDQTSPEVVATTVAMGRRQGKTVIVVKDGAGFYVNRILAPYMNEAAHLLKEGVPIDRIDQALLRFGFPVGPFALLDAVGIYVGSKVAPILYDAFGERMKPVDSAEQLLADGRYGKKSGRGFYKYDGGRKGAKVVDESVYALLGVVADQEIPAEEIIDRTVLMMVNEAARCLDEGVIRNLHDGDIGAIFGIGFPPFRGGPFRYADSRGIQPLVNRLGELKASHGERFAPAELLVRMAEEGRGFY
jgi:3-hydroxyacyl-CoA dehydrogenase/enoyl-CoA hydratase/3-hydroxybutyryl-CoA epimerase